MPDRESAPDTREAQSCFTVDPTKFLKPDQAAADNKVPSQVFAMMAVTTLVTFGTLSSGYSLLY